MLFGSALAVCLHYRLLHKHAFGQCRIYCSTRHLDLATGLADVVFVCKDCIKKTDVASVESSGLRVSVVKFFIWLSLYFF